MPTAFKLSAGEAISHAANPSCHHIQLSSISPVATDSNSACYVTAWQRAVAGRWCPKRLLRSSISGQEDGTNRRKAGRAVEESVEAIVSSSACTARHNSFNATRINAGVRHFTYSFTIAFICATISSIDRTILHRNVKNSTRFRPGHVL